MPDKPMYLPYLPYLLISLFSLGVEELKHESDSFICIFANSYTWLSIKVQIRGLALLLLQNKLNVKVLIDKCNYCEFVDG